MISFIASHIHSHIKSLSGWFAHLQEIRKRILANNFTDNLNIESEDNCCNESVKELRQKNWIVPSQLS